MRLPLFSAEPRHQQPNHIAEVIETSTTEFLAQCLEPEDLSFPIMPSFGCWVKSMDEDGTAIYGVVYYATTAPVDSVHRARALGLSLEQLREQQPQIFAMLKTEIKVAIVGFVSGGKTYQHLPSRPPQIHQAVYTCNADEIEQFTEELHFLRSLIQISGAPVDELASAVVRDVYQARKCDRQWLVQAGRQLSILLKDDYDRLSAILSQVHP